MRILAIVYCRLQDDYIEAKEKEDISGMQEVLASYDQLIDSVKTRIRKETMRSAKALVTHALFPEILRPVNGKMFLMCSKGFNEMVKIILA